jgi:hypothetical protein
MKRAFMELDTPVELIVPRNPLTGETDLLAHRPAVSIGIQIWYSVILVVRQPIHFFAHPFRQRTLFQHEELP